MKPNDRKEPILTKRRDLLRKRQFKTDDFEWMAKMLCGQQIISETYLRNVTGVMLSVSVHVGTDAEYGTYYQTPLGLFIAAGRKYPYTLRIATLAMPCQDKMYYIPSSRVADMLETKQGSINQGLSIRALPGKKETIFYKASEDPIIGTAVLIRPEYRLEYLLRGK